MKQTLIILALYVVMPTTILTMHSGCKTPEQKYQEYVDNSSDEELMNEIIGKPLSYEVQYRSIADVYIGNGFTSFSSSLTPAEKEQFLTEGVNEGAVLQVIFTKGSVWVEKFNRMNGEYKAEKFANSDGTTTLKFGDFPPNRSRTDAIGLGSPASIGLNNPVRRCERLGIEKKYIIPHNGGKIVVTVHYYLKSLTKPGYFTENTK
jgi:hypothetical protein